MSRILYDINKYNLMSLRILKSVLYDSNITYDANGIIYIDNIPYKINDKTQLLFNKKSRAFKTKHKSDYQYLDFIKNYNELCELITDNIDDISFKINKISFNASKIIVEYKGTSIIKIVENDKVGLEVYRIINDIMEE